MFLFWLRLYRAVVKSFAFDPRLSVLICEISGKGFLLSGHGDVGYPGYYFVSLCGEVLGFQIWQLPDFGNFGNLVFTCQTGQLFHNRPPM
jgi:hypothetical protein